MTPIQKWIGAQYASFASAVGPALAGGVDVAEHYLQRLHWRLRGQVPSYRVMYGSAGPDLSGKAAGLLTRIFIACTGAFGDKSPPTQFFNQTNESSSPNMSSPPPSS